MLVLLMTLQLGISLGRHELGLQHQQQIQTPYTADLTDNLGSVGTGTSSHTSMAAASLRLGRLLLVSGTSSLLLLHIGTICVLAKTNHAHLHN